MKKLILKKKWEKKWILKKKMDFEKWILKKKTDFEKKLIFWKNLIKNGNINSTSAKIQKCT